MSDRPGDAYAELALELIQGKRHIKDTRTAEELVIAQVYATLALYEAATYVPRVITTVNGATGATFQEPIWQSWTNPRDR